MSEHSAVFSREAYNMLGSGNKEKRLKKINENIKYTGFKATGKSNRDMLHLVNETTGEHHISVRGTDASFKSKKTKEDIMTDLKFALGKEKHDKHFKKKINRIDNLIKETPKKSKVSLSGHSLGGGIVTEAVKTKRNIRNRVDNTTTYNSAFSPFTKSASKQTKKDLKDKLTHHRNKYDLMSASSIANNTVGTVVEHEPKQSKKLDKLKVIPENLKHVFNSVDQLKHHSIDQFIDDE